MSSHSLKRIPLSTILALLMVVATIAPTTFSSDISTGPISPGMIPNVNGTISGNVESDGTPLSGLLVSVIDTHDVVLASNTTTSSGDFDFGSSSFLAGTYSVAVEGGYRYNDAMNNSVTVNMQLDTHVQFDPSEKEKGRVTGVAEFNDTVPDGGGTITDVIINEKITGSESELVGQTSVTPISNGEWFLWVYRDYLNPGDSVTIEAQLEHYQTEDIDVTLDSLKVSENNTIVLTPDWPIEDVLPPYMAVDFPAIPNLMVKFLKTMEPSTFNSTTVSLQGQDTRSNLLNQNSFEFDNLYRELTITPSQIMMPDMTYTLTIGTEVRTYGNETTSTFPFWTDYITWFSIADCPCLLQGYILDNSTGEPIEGATITIDTLSASTDSDGYFTSSPIWGYDIPVKVIKAGYYSINRTIDILPWAPLLDINLSLDPRPFPFQSNIVNGTTEVPTTNFTFVATFDVELDLSEIEDDTITILSKDQTLYPGHTGVSGTIWYDNKVLTFIAVHDLNYGTTYVIKLDSDDIKDLSGNNVLWENWSAQFSTDSSLTSIVIEVKDRITNDSIHDAEVELEAPGGITWAGHTEIDGRLKFERMPINVWFNITVNASGYEEVKKMVYSAPYEKFYTIIMDKIEPLEKGHPESVQIWIGPFKDTDGDPIRGAKITLEFCDKQFVAVTDANGYATFAIPEEDLLDCGDLEDLSVSFEHEDYESQDSEISLSEILDDLDDGTVNITIPENEPGPVEPSDPDEEYYGALVMIIIIAIILVLVIIFLLSRIHGMQKTTSKRSDQRASKSCPRCLSTLPEGSKMCPSCGFRKGGPY